MYLLCKLLLLTSSSFGITLITSLYAWCHDTVPPSLGPALAVCQLSMAENEKTARSQMEVVRVPSSTCSVPLHSVNCQCPCLELGWSTGSLVTKSLSDIFHYMHVAHSVSTCSLIDNWVMRSFIYYEFLKVMNKSAYGELQSVFFSFYIFFCEYN